MNDDVSRLTPDGRTVRWTKHRATRREELIAAATAEIAEHGEDVGMDRIAAAAGTSKPVIYRYFTDREDLHDAVAAQVATEIVRTLEKVHTAAPPGIGDEARALTRRAIDAYLRLVEERPTLFRFVIGRQPRHGHTDPIAAVLAAALAEQLHACGLDPAASRPWGDAAVGFIRAASLWWLDGERTMSRRHLTDYLAALLWGGAAGVFQYAGHDVDARPEPGVFRLGTPRA